MIRIIVSSDWRRLFDDATLIRLLAPLATRFVGVVERAKRMGSAG
jgi:hypothetical protein